MVSASVPSMQCLLPPLTGYFAQGTAAPVTNFEGGADSVPGVVVHRLLSVPLYQCKGCSSRCLKECAGWCVVRRVTCMGSRSYLPLGETTFPAGVKLTCTDGMAGTRNGLP
jgi:hypothetical protein